MPNTGVVVDHVIGRVLASDRTKHRLSPSSMLQIYVCLLCTVLFSKTSNVYVLVAYAAQLNYNFYDFGAYQLQ